MIGDETRDARRTERYLDGLLSADERRAPGVPVDVEIDPAVGFAARALRTGLTRVHPSFRFEDALAGRLAAGATRLRGGLPLESPAPFVVAGAVARFRGGSATAAATVATIYPAAASTASPTAAGRPSRPLIVGGVGVGVASAAISIGAVYVAWRHSHTASTRMGRAVRAAHGRAAHAGRSRRAGVINGIRGVMS